MVNRSKHWGNPDPAKAGGHNAFGPPSDRFTDPTSHQTTREERPTRKCSKCEKVMYIRTNSHTGQEFWGCSDYPECRHTENKPSE